MKYSDIQPATGVEIEHYKRVAQEFNANNWSNRDVLSLIRLIEDQSARIVSLQKQVNELEDELVERTV